MNCLTRPTILTTSLGTTSIFIPLPYSRESALIPWCALPWSPLLLDKHVSNFLQHHNITAACGLHHPQFREGCWLQSWGHNPQLREGCWLQSWGHCWGAPHRALSQPDHLLHHHLGDPGAGLPHPIQWSQRHQARPALRPHHSCFLLHIRGEVQQLPLPLLPLPSSSSRWRSSSNTAGEI